MRYLLFICLIFSAFTQQSYKDIKLNPEFISVSVSREVSGPALVFSGKEVLSLREKLELMNAEIGRLTKIVNKSDEELDKVEKNFDNYKKLTNMEIDKLNAVNEILLKSLKTVADSLNKSGGPRKSPKFLSILKMIGVGYSVGTITDSIKKF